MQVSKTLLNHLNTWDMSLLSGFFEILIDSRMKFHC